MRSRNAHIRSNDSMRFTRTQTDCQSKTLTLKTYFGDLSRSEFEYKGSLGCHKRRFGFPKV